MKGQERRETVSGYLTVYLALILAVLLSLCLTLIEGARSNAIRIETECVTDIGLNSILAEYHRELFAQYNLFTIDSSYGTGTSGVDEITKHLQEYMERNLSLEDVFLSNYIYRDFLKMSVDSVEMTGASLMTDGNGAVFRRRAVEAIQDDCNLTLLRDLQQWMQVIEDNGLRERDVAAEKNEVDEQIQAYDGREIQIAEGGSTVAQVENPTDGLEKIRKSGILKYVVEDEETLSGKALSSGNLIVSRMEDGDINQGNMPVTVTSGTEQLVERFFFQEYLIRYLGHYGKEKEGGALSYQLEYLIADNQTDVENLKQIVNTICAVREAANALYLFSDVEKCTEAEALATLLATLLQIPEITALFKVAILLGWSYAESLYDVEVLLAGGRIPLIKDKESWHYNIQSALSFTGDEVSEGSEGLSYEDYLRIMMMFVDLDTLTGRAMNMVEADIRMTPGNAYFRLDNCFDRVEFCIRMKSEYGYEYEITGKRGYQ